MARSLVNLIKKNPLDFDFKRGDQHKSLNKDKITQNDFFNFRRDDIEKYKVSNNFYCLPKITQLTDSFNFIYSEKFSSVLEEIKAEFDLVIIDTTQFYLLQMSGSYGIFGCKLCGLQTRVV